MNLTDVIRIAYTWKRILSEDAPVISDSGAGVNYYEYLKSDKWRRKSAEAKARAGNRCQVCNSPRKLNTHHRTYEHLGDEPPEDLTVLCNECHKTFSKQRKLSQG
jgi:hypothetical protein